MRYDYKKPCGLYYEHCYGPRGVIYYCKLCFNLQRTFTIVH